jgi:hypothetical protein
LTYRIYPKSNYNNTSVFSPPSTPQQMNKTAMMMLISKLEELQKTKGVGYWVIDAAKVMLPTEKQQIEDARNEGYKLGFSNGKDYGQSIT